MLALHSLTALALGHYCEENIYLLLQALASDPSVTNTWDLNAVFISNHTKSARPHSTPEMPTWD